MATLLLADDSMTTQKVVSLTFADEGVEVLTAADGDTAVKLYHERQPDIVLADVNIPGLSGYEICEEIRKTSDLATTPVVLLVGSFEPFDANEAHRVGANDYLTKPFSSIRRLVATVLAFLDDQSETLEPNAAVDEQVQEISVEPAQEETVATQPDESNLQTAGYDDVEPAFGAQSATEAPAVEEPEQPSELSTETAPAASDEHVAAEEPNFHSTTDIEELYVESFAETVEMPHTLGERARFSDVSSDDGLIEAQFTGMAAEEAATQDSVEPIADQQTPLEPTSEPEYSAEPASEPQSFEQPQEDVGPDQQSLTEPETTEPTAEPENGHAAWSDGSAPEVHHPAAFDQRQFDAPTERLTPQNATTEEYNFEFRSEEAFFEPAPEPLTGPPEPVSTDEHSAQIDSGSQQVAQEQPPVETASTPWETVASPSDSGVTFDDRNLLEIPGQVDGGDEPRHIPEQGLSMETVEHIARIVASQMSEQIIREIAERVVPMVVQQTLANKRDD